jgi:hypothetical protein
MPEFCAVHRLPRARIDPIDTPEAAVSMVSVLMSRPPRFETIVIPLDDQRRGLSVVVVAGTVEPDSFFDILDIVGLAAAGSDEVAGLVVATVRPHGGVDDRDVDRWLEGSALLGDRGIELVEWFIVGEEICCPRDLLGERPRWRS